MKKLLMIFLVLVVMALPSLAQGNPTCQITVGPWTDTNATTIFYNGANTQCAYWILTYQVTGFSAVSIEVDSALGTSSGPGAFGLFSGTTVSGSNPSTSVACATVTNCTLVLSGVVGWYRVSFTSHSGSGTIQGTLQGYKAYTALGGNTPVGGSGCPGTSVTPCVVDGVTAAGSPPTTAPVLVAGQDGTNIRTLKTDATGVQQAVGPGATGAAVVGAPVRVAGSDGTNTRNMLTDALGDLQVGKIGFGTFTTNQQAVTATAANLGTAASRAVCVLALSTNTIPVYVGGAGVTTSTGLPLVPGQSTCQPVSNTNLVFVVASTTGAGVAWSLVN